MDLSTGINLGQLLLALGVMLVSGGIAWGIMHQRVNTLEKEVQTLSSLKTDLAVLVERTEHIKAGMDAITGSWLFQQPPAYTPSAPKPARSRP